MNTFAQSHRHFKKILSKFRKHKTVVTEKPFLISVHISGRLYCPKNSYESPSDLLYCCDILLLSNAYMKSDVKTK